MDNHIWKRNKSTLSPISFLISIVDQQNFGGIFDFDAKQKRLDKISQLEEDPASWSDSKRAQELGREKKILENVVLTLETIRQQLQDSIDLFQMAKEENDIVMLESICSDVVQS